MSPRVIPDIGAQLKGLREAAELSQQDLAMKAGLSISVVFQIEQGRKKDPRLSSLVAMAEPLGMTPGQLVDELLKPASARKKGGRK